MRPSERLDIISKVARELQSRYTYSDIDTFLAAYKIKHPTGSSSFNSKRIYSKEALENVDNELLLKIAAELNVVSGLRSENKKIIPPKIWEDCKDFKLFISHLAAHKDKATKLKESLKKYHILSFVAHEDITPTLPWQEEIEKALYSMEAMLCIHTKGFSESPWTQQEIGFGLSRGVRIISLRMDEDPKGFIYKRQAILPKGRDADGVAEEINTILISDPITKDIMNEVRSNHQVKDDFPPRF